MQYSFDPIVCVVAVLALWFAFYELRSNNNVVLRVKECRGSVMESVYENREQEFAYLSVVIRNHGICLHDLAVSLSFCVERGGGRMSLGLVRAEGRTSQHDQFSKGMVAEFSLKSYELEPGDTDMFLYLKKPREQLAAFDVWSQGFIARQFRIGGFRDRIARRWNPIAYRFNRLFKKRTGTSPEGFPVVRTPKILPVLPALDQQVMSFISSLEELKSRSPS